jgi:hypothetical protein
MDEDSANDSFLSFLRQSRDHDVEPTDPKKIDLPAAISTIRNDCADGSKIFVLLAEIERVFRSIAHIPFSRRSIPATRLFLRDMGRQVFASGYGDETLGKKIGRVLLDLEHIEKSIEKRVRPNLGQSLSDDFDGSNRLAKFLRYEGHIERSLYKALAEFQKLQILRASRWMPDPSDDPAQPPVLEP